VPAKKKVCLVEFDGGEDAAIAAEKNSLKFFYNIFSKVIELSTLRLACLRHSVYSDLKTSSVCLLLK